MDPGALCRAVESYLCRKNDGHLIRIVGPAFEMVCGWGVRRHSAERGGAGHRPELRALLRPGAEAASPCASSTASPTCSTCSTSGSVRSGVGGPYRRTRSRRAQRAWRRRAQTATRRDRAGGARWRPISTISPRACPPGSRRPALPRSTACCSRRAPPVDAARAGGKTLRGEARRRVLEQLADLQRRLPAAARADAGRRRAARAPGGGAARAGAVSEPDAARRVRGRRRSRHRPAARRALRAAARGVRMSAARRPPRSRAPSPPPTGCSSSTSRSRAWRSTERRAPRVRGYMRRGTSQPIRASARVNCRRQ